ncbi:hypothetical protein NC651_018572 [Populus alba x Populus x berolinensis]|nr:hypothetical protein NC651_018572 [Populus alba x Populus x berolinensis]
MFHNPYLSTQPSTPIFTLNFYCPCFSIFISQHNPPSHLHLSSLNLSHNPPSQPPSSSLIS